MFVDVGWGVLYPLRGGVAPSLSGVVMAQAGSPQLNWWDGLVESWLNLPLWVQAALAAFVIALAIALAGSVVLWVSSAVAERQARMSIPASIRYGWLAIPGWSKAVQFSLIGVVVLVGFTALSGRPVADLRVSKTEVVFGGVVAGGTATSDLTLTNLGTAGSPAIKVEQVTVSGEDAALFSVVSGAEAVVPTGGDAVVHHRFCPGLDGAQGRRPAGCAFRCQFPCHGASQWSRCPGGPDECGWAGDR